MRYILKKDGKKVSLKQLAENISRIENELTKIQIARIVWWDYFADSKKENNTSLNWSIARYRELLKSKSIDSIDINDVKKELIKLGYKKRQAILRLKGLIGTRKRYNNG